MTIAQQTSSRPDFRERAKANDVPVARLIGFEAERISGGRAAVVLAAGPPACESHGDAPRRHSLRHCGCCNGVAFASTLGPDESFTTIELKINFFRPVWQAQLRAEGVVVQRGRNIGYLECSITDEQRRVIATASSTCMVLRGDMPGDGEPCNSDEFSILGIVSG